MKHLIVSIAALTLFGQTRTDTFDAQTITITEMVLTPRPDGGCAARWCGEVTSADGGVELSACTDGVELKGATNQNRCAQLGAAGVNRVGRALRFDTLDAGAP